ncbi:MAG: hypothetical protein Q7S74_04620 [Nanoarchaeota archaeon]|nr:hypothetical protein [Nanoarchaeota archaeon]
MRKIYWTVIASLSIIILVGVVALFLYKPGISYAPSSINESSCKSLDYKGKNAINLVFFSNKENAKKYSHYLISMPPYNGYKDSFNVYYIDDYTPECELYKGVAVLCYSRELLKKVAACPNDYLFVVKGKDVKIRSSTYMNVVSINSRHPLSVLLHESGHVFANLADEYVPAKLSSNSKNCVSQCSKFGNESNGCWAGCSEENYFRSIDSGVMRTASSVEYGALDSSLISLQLSKQKGVISGFAVESELECAKENYYLIEGLYNEGEIKVLDKTVESGCIGSNGVGNFNYSVVMWDGSKVSAGEFNPEFIFTDSPGVEDLEGGLVSSDRSFFLRVPLVKDAKEIDITNENYTTQISLGDIGGRPCRI